MVGREVVDATDVDELFQFPEPTEASNEETGWEYEVRIWRRVMTSVVNGTAAPSVGKSCMVLIRRLISSSSSENDDFAVSRTGLTASESCGLS